MTKTDEEMEYDLERIFQDKNLLEQPVIAKAKKIWEDWGRMRNRYVAAGLAMHIGNNDQAAVCNDVVHDWSLALHDDTHKIRDAIAKSAKAAAEEERCEARRKETLSWLEEES